MLTESKPDFFKVLSGVRKLVAEAVFVRLYDAMYRDHSNTTMFDRKFLKDIVSEEFERYAQADEGDESRSSAIPAFLAQLEASGWILFEYDKIEMYATLIFSSEGKKIAQALYELHSKNISTRLRNVRSTFNSIQVYVRTKDAYDLLDADAFSEYVVSDLMEWIDEINATRKLMHQKAMQSSREAGQVYFEFLQNEFHSIAVNLTDDSADKYSPKISEIIYTILDNEMNLENLNRDLIRKFPQFQEQEFVVETILENIMRRIQSASNSMLPQIYASISQLTRNSEMLLKQASAIVSHKDPYVAAFASKIKESSEKESSLELFEHFISVPKIELFDPEKVMFHERKKRESSITILKKESKVSEKVRRRKALEKAYREAFGFTPKDVKGFIDTMLNLDDGESVTLQMPIRSYRDLLMVLNSTSIAKKFEDYELVHTDISSRNDYFESKNIIIRRRAKV